ncbi:hypothetical protein Drorol1_Dr00000799 [Drosera rotundifolia]
MNGPDLLLTKSKISFDPDLDPLDLQRLPSSSHSSSTLLLSPPSISPESAHPPPPSLAAAAAAADTIDDEDLVYLRPPAKKMKSSVPVANGVSNVNSATATYSTAKWLDVKCLRLQHDGNSCTYKDKRIHYSSLRAGKLYKSVGSKREEYHLKADNGDSQSQTVQLNGEALVVNYTGEIPALEPIIVMNLSYPIVVDPLSIYRIYNYALWDSMIPHKLFYFTVNSYI